MQADKSPMILRRSIVHRQSAIVNRLLSSKVRGGVSCILLGFVAAILASPAGVLPGQLADPGKERAASIECAATLMTQARAAIGDSKTLQDIKTLTASGRIRRFIRYVSVQSQTKVLDREKTLNGKIDIEFMFPDKYRKRISTVTLYGNNYSFSEVVNGDRAWRDPPREAASYNRDRRVIDVSDFERSLFYQAETARQQHSVYSLAWLVQNVPGSQLEFRCRGWLDLQSEKADAIVMYAGDDYQPWFLLNRTTHVPMGVVSSLVASREEPVIVEAMAFDPRYRRALLSKAMQIRKARSNSPKKMIIQMLFSDHRRIAGILLPHRKTTLIDGVLVEEIVISKFEVNRPLNPKNFEPKKARK